MAEYRIRYDWQLKSAELAVIINCHTTGDQVAFDAFVPKTPEERQQQREQEIIYDPALNKAFRKMIINMYPEMNKDIEDGQE